MVCEGSLSDESCFLFFVSSHCVSCLIFTSIHMMRLDKEQADREGYIAIIMPKPADWLKVKAALLGLEEYKRLKEQC